jgi:hypothetical protein
VKVTVSADPAGCGTLFDPVGIRAFTAPCDIARRTLATSSVKYTTEAAPAGAPTIVKINNAEVPFVAGPGFAKSVGAALEAAGYPKAGDPNIVRMSSVFDIFRPQVASIIGLLFILIIYVTMVYGPIAAALVELFPTRIRYTAMSLPYHIGNGWFGGLLPATALAMVVQTGDIYYGLWYPIIFALITFVVGMLFIPETKDRNIYAND